MLVNIARSKLLINKNQIPRQKKSGHKAAHHEQMRCNHCGGLVKSDGELVSCLMCSRDKDHICESCSFVQMPETSKVKKSA